MTNSLRLVFCGDRSLMVYLGDTIDVALNERVHALVRTLKANPHPALVEVTPSYHAVLVEYDPVRIRPEQVEDLVRSAAEAESPELAPGRTITVPVCYGGETGPDLAAVAEHTGLSEAEVIRLHTRPDYRVYTLGFSPGFPYLGGLDPLLETPRLANPRTVVPGGSVGIAGSQTGIYPAASPGGWQLIGRTPVQLFDPLRQPPALLEAGDTVRFEAISPEAFAEAEAAAPRPERQLPAYTQGLTGLKIIQPGLATTTQDLGRRGFMRYGVPTAGAADFVALMVGNWLLANRARTSALEITVTGPEVEFTGPVAFSLTGAPVPAELIPADGSPAHSVPMWTALLASPGDRLRIGTLTAGCRSYLCLAGGIDLPPVLGSLSEDLFAKIGPLGRPLQAGDWLPTGLPLQPVANLVGRSVARESIPDFSAPVTIRVTRGPQQDAFTAAAFETLLSSEYVIGAQSDRQGLRLEGPALTHSGSADILSEPVPAGSIQVPANGQPILLLGNRQTTGGYAKIAVALFPDLANAAQLRPGDKVRFKEVDSAEAHAIAWAERRRLAQIRRFLERESVRQMEVDPQQLARLMAQVPTAAPEAEAAPAEAAPVPQTAPQPLRTFRITIGDIEYEASVEEVEE